MIILINITGLLGAVAIKKRLVLAVLGLFLFSLVSSTVSAGLMGTWVPTIRSVGGTRLPQGQLPEQETVYNVAQLNADLLTFEGLLEAYSVSGDQNVEEQVLLASNDISISLLTLNSELTNIYKDLSTEQQSDLQDAYISLGSYIETLAEEANQIFQDEDGKAKAKFEVQQVGVIFENLPNQLWVGSAISV